MKKIITILFILMAVSASAQRAKEQNQAVTDFKNEFATGAIFDVVGKTIFIGGLISIVEQHKNNPDAIVLMAIGGSCSIIGTVFTIKGIRSSVKAGQTKNGVGLTLTF